MPQNARVRTWPAVDVRSAADPDLALATIDDFGPTAVEPRGNDVRVFFPSESDRDAACIALRAAQYLVESIDVEDDDWARRSQEDLRPITVDRITVTPPWNTTPAVTNPESATTNGHSPAPIPQPAITIVIQPSMGFGTGHHATTRLCLRALQAIDLSNRFVLDVGTGSGVLALAAARLGAAQAIGVDYDADAIQSAVDNLTLNADIHTVTFEVGDLFSSSLPVADVVTANLTGAVLVRAAQLLGDQLRPGGTLVVSGLLCEERGDVVRAFGSADVIWEEEEEGWLALVIKRQRDSE